MKEGRREGMKVEKKECKINNIMKNKSIRILQRDRQMIHSGGTQSFQIFVL